MISKQQKRLLAAFGAPFWRSRLHVHVADGSTEQDQTGATKIDTGHECKIVCVCPASLSIAGEPLLSSLISALQPLQAQLSAQMVNLDDDSAAIPSLKSIQPDSWVITIDCLLELNDHALRVVSIPSWHDFQRDPAQKKKVWDQICQMSELHGA